MNEITKLIDQINGDIQGPTEELLPLVYDELRRLAANRMNDERTDHTLTPTALVHEAYLRLVGHTRGPDWSGRGHFFAAAAEAMRRILIDHARSKNAIKRGGGAKRLDLVESWLISNPQANGLIELDEALSALEAVDSEAAMLVKLRFFVGMTNEQAAENLQLSPRKANMLWAFARSWLKRSIADND